MKKLLIIPLLFACFMSIGQTESSAFIIGKPIRIGNLLIAEWDFRNTMTWSDAKRACATLGRGWRLPTTAEHDKIYLKINELNDIKFKLYWTSDYNNWITGSNTEYYVRAVRSL
jgi:hypothetical protein